MDLDSLVLTKQNSFFYHHTWALLLFFSIMVSKYSSKKGRKGDLRLIIVLEVQSYQEVPNLPGDKGSSCFV